MSSPMHYTTRAGFGACKFMDLPGTSPYTVALNGDRNPGTVDAVIETSLRVKGDIQRRDLALSGQWQRSWCSMEDKWF